MSQHCPLICALSMCIYSSFSCGFAINNLVILEWMWLDIILNKINESKSVILKIWKSRTGRLVSLLTLYLSLCMTISFLLSYQLEILSCLSLGKMVGAVPARETTSSCEGIIAVFFLWITWTIKWKIQRATYHEFLMRKSQLQEWHS